MDETVVRKLEFYDPLTDAEFAELAKQAAETSDHITQLEAQKKISADNFKNQITSKEEILKELLEQVRTGSKTVYPECTIQYNYPLDGKKTITRKDLPNTFIDTEDVKRVMVVDMSDEDFQLFRTNEPEENDFDLSEFGIDHSIVNIANEYRIIKTEDDLTVLGLDTEDFYNLKDKLIAHFDSESDVKNCILSSPNNTRRFGNYVLFTKAEQAEHVEED